ncbi:MAG: 50S ribosomal protein L18 [Planctomycetota bacterium]|jgi:large subunit ribosomal protein L18
MDRSKHRIIRRTRRQAGLRRKVVGRPDRPRLAVFRSGRHMYAQLIDDLAGRTLAAASTVDRQQKTQPGSNCQAAAAVGTLLAQRAQEAHVKKIVFDRRGYKYHGRVKALADAARKAGLEF